MSHTISLGEVIPYFAIHGEFLAVEPYGSGHINQTYVSLWNQAGLPVRYIHQRINQEVFIRPDKVMENIIRVTDHLTKKFREARLQDISRRTLTVVGARTGGPWVWDSAGGWWRTYLFIERTHAREVAESPQEARFLGNCIGHFQKQLADLGGSRLHETIPDFHHMAKRYQRFYRALAEDPCGRVREVSGEIAFMRENEERGSVLIRDLENGALPERICHNDTKMNNILIDDDPHSDVHCVGDLDTVMPGTCLFDLGDLIRTVANRAREDEGDLSQVCFDPVYFQALLEGYLSEAAVFLIQREWELLAESGRNITQIMGLRFLTDYLEGDHYYQTSRPGHNLDRCRNQIALIKSMDSQWEALQGIVLRLAPVHP